MVLLEALGFSLELKRFPGPYLLMPEGLYDPRERLLRFSRLPAAVLHTPFVTGDSLTLLSAPSFSVLRKERFADSFGLAPPLRPALTETFPSFPALSVVEVMSRVEAFASRTGQTVYESFLEYMVLLTFMESLKNSKVTLGGVWAGESADPSGRRVKGYEVFVRALEEKNRIVDRLKELASGYRTAALEEIALFRLTGPRPSLAAYALYLERFYLYLHLKNTVQRFHLMLAYAGEEEKARYEKALASERRVLAAYESG